jgi:hypothetical protein
VTSDAGLAVQQHHLAFGGNRPLPAAQQQLYFLLAPDKRRQGRAAQCLEPADDSAFADDAPRALGFGKAGERLRPEIVEIKQGADLPARILSNDQAIGPGQGLQPRCEVGRLANHRQLLRRPFADQIADHRKPGSYPDARLQLDGLNIEATDGVDDTQPCPHCPLGIVLMRGGVSEIDQDAVAHIFGDKALEAPDDLGDGAMIGADHLPQILGIELRREFRRAD